jgi:hypothetical protein
MRNLKPIFVEYSRVPRWLSRVAPINIGAITLFCVVFSRGKISDTTKRHETIHFQQYLETLVLGFLVLYLFDFLWLALVKGKGFSSEAYKGIRLEQEAHAMDRDTSYLATRKRFAWLRYYSLG